MEFLIVLLIQLGIFFNADNVDRSGILKEYNANKAEVDRIAHEQHYSADIFINEDERI